MVKPLQTTSLTTLRPFFDLRKNTRNVLSSLISEKPASEQAAVDFMAINIESAIGFLDMKPADYTAVDAAVAAAEKLDKTSYKDFSAVEAAIEAVFEGLVIGGIAMAYAGVSRPASGVEHYFSHVWDMRGLEFGTRVDLHGIQCAMATEKAAKLYDAVRKLRPDWEKASAYVQEFDYEAWAQELKAFLGASADTMIALEAKEGKYRKDTHKARFELIAENWDSILKILQEEIPPYEEILRIMNTIGISTDLTVLDIDSATARQTFRATKDIRDKYVLSRLAWDLGILEDLCQLL